MISQELRHDVRALIDRDEEKLISLRLISQQQPGYTIIVVNGRLTDLGFRFCQNVETYVLETLGRTGGMTEMYYRANSRVPLSSYSVPEGTTAGAWERSLLHQQSALPIAVFVDLFRRNQRRGGHPIAFFQMQQAHSL